MHTVGEAVYLWTQVVTRLSFYTPPPKVAKREEQLREGLLNALARMGISGDELPDHGEDPEDLSEEAEAAFAAYLAYARQKNLATGTALF